MREVEKDLGTKLDWVAVDHWNTDNPHVHVLIRGRADDGRDLVISREYISRGFRDRAAVRVTLELGPRSEQEIRTALEREVESERWTSLGRALRDIADDCGGVADLRPGPDPEYPELRRLLLGRAAKLERLGLTDSVGPACWVMSARKSRSGSVAGHRTAAAGPVKGRSIGPAGMSTCAEFVMKKVFAMSERWACVWPGRTGRARTTGTGGPLTGCCGSG